MWEIFRCTSDKNPKISTINENDMIGPVGFQFFSELIVQLLKNLWNSSFMFCQKSCLYKLTKMLCMSLNTQSYKVHTNCLRGQRWKILTDVKASSRACECCVLFCFAHFYYSQPLDEILNLNQFSYKRQNISKG